MHDFIIIYIFNLHLGGNAEGAGPHALALTPPYPHDWVMAHK